MRSTEMRRRRCLRQGDKARRKGRREQIRSILDAESSDDREGVGAESESAGQAMVHLEVTYCRSWNHVLVPQGWELR